MDLRPKDISEADLILRLKPKDISEADLNLQLKPKDIKPLREALIQEQGGLCLLCEKPLVRPVLDHSHFSGLCRGAICSTCNVILGAYENKVVRMGRKEDRLVIAKNLGKYIQNERNEVHPTHNRKKRVKKVKKVLTRSKK